MRTDFGLGDYDRIILRGSDVGQWRYDMEDNRVYMDAAARKLYGFDLESESVSRTDMVKRLVEEDIEQVRDALQRAEAGESVELDFRVRRPDGTIQHILSQVCMIPSVNGKAPTIGGTFVDAKYIAPYQARVQRKENEFRLLADGSPFAFAFINADLRYEFVNRAYTDTFGGTLDEMRGKQLSDIVKPEELETSLSIMNRVLAGETFETEQHGVRGKAKGRYLRHRFAPAIEDGSCVGIFCQTFDITDLHELSESLKLKHDELMRSNADLEQFAYVASHDLKAPLRAISVIIEWLKDDLEEYEEGDVQENLDLLHQRTGRLSKLLDDLLAYSRAGRKSGEVEHIDFRQLVSEIVELHGAADMFEVDITSGPLSIEAHRTPLEQVLRNLISNAVKHHPSERGALTVHARDAGSHYEFGVADDGEGIPQEYAERVFKMFQTLKPRDETEGSGMGLAIVARIVSLYDGKVWFEPGENGRGTVFRFTWRKPVAEDTALDAQAA